MFGRVYKNKKDRIVFDSKGGTWLSASMEDDGVFIDKTYLSCEPSLSVKQARKFANKILGFCDDIEAIKKPKLARH